MPVYPPGAAFGDPALDSEAARLSPAPDRPQRRPKWREFLARSETITIGACFSNGRQPITPASPTAKPTGCVTRSDRCRSPSELSWQTPYKCNLCQGNTPVRVLINCPSCGGTGPLPEKVLKEKRRGARIKAGIGRQGWITPSPDQWGQRPG